MLPKKLGTKGACLSLSYVANVWELLDLLYLICSFSKPYSTCSYPQMLTRECCSQGVSGNERAAPFGAHEYPLSRSAAAFGSPSHAVLHIFKSAQQQTSSKDVCEDVQLSKNKVRWRTAERQIKQGSFTIKAL